MFLTRLFADNHPLYDLWSLHPTIFNEEQCEAQLSSLARFVANDFSKHDGVALHRQFLMTYKVREACKSDTIRHDRRLVPAAPWRHVLSPDCPDLLETVSFFKGRIRQLKTNQFLCYTGDMKHWKDSKAGSSTLGSVDPELWGIPNTSDFVRMMILRTKTESSRAWTDLEHWRQPLARVQLPLADDVPPESMEEYFDAAFAEHIPPDGPEDDVAPEPDADPDQRMPPPGPPLGPQRVRPARHSFAAPVGIGRRSQGTGSRIVASQSKRPRAESEEKMPPVLSHLPDPQHRSIERVSPDEGERKERRIASPSRRSHSLRSSGARPAPMPGREPDDDPSGPRSVQRSGRAQRSTHRSIGWYTELPDFESSSDAM